MDSGDSEEKGYKILKHYQGHYITVVLAVDEETTVRDCYLIDEDSGFIFVGTTPDYSNEALNKSIIVQIVSNGLLADIDGISREEAEYYVDVSNEADEGVKH